MIQQILNELNKKYNNNFIVRMKNGDYDFYYKNERTNISLTDGDKGDFNSIFLLIERELFYYIGIKAKINTEDKNGIAKLSSRSKIRGRRQHK